MDNQTIENNYDMIENIGDYFWSREVLDVTLQRLKNDFSWDLMGDFCPLVKSER